jgi:hypothetical protein
LLKEKGLCGLFARINDTNRDKDRRTRFGKNRGG